MRCFIAIDLPSHIKSRIFHKFEILFGKRLFKGKNCMKDSLHLTLKFLGEVTEEQIKKIDEDLKKIKLSKFDCSIGKVGIFDNEDNIKIIWVNLIAEEIFKLQKQVAKNFKREDMGFHPHITTSRVVEVVNKNALLKELRNINFKKLDFEVGEFLLMKSEITKEGLKYKVLKRYALG
jgi:RNA 2',3'-cyclic 3'-phosphodiesterase